MVNLSSLSFRSPLLQIVVFHSEALAFCDHRHSGIMNVNQAPAALYFLIELRFAAVGGEGGAVFSELGGKIPIEFGLGGVAENMDGNVVNAQFAFREVIAHQSRVDVLLDL